MVVDEWWSGVKNPSPVVVGLTDVVVVSCVLVVFVVLVYELWWEVCVEVVDVESSAGAFVNVGIGM